MKTLIPVLFALGTALFWGCYGPTIGNAQAPRPNGTPLWSPFKPYVFIGMAYVVIGVFGGLIMMRNFGDSFEFFKGEHYKTALWGFLAGSLGAFGALCLTTAMMTSKGNALLVMPIVFGGAVSVSAIVSVWRLHEGTSVSPLLWVGMGITVIGIIMVASNTPHGHGPAKPAAAHAGGEDHLESEAKAEIDTAMEPDSADEGESKEQDE